MTKNLWMSVPAGALGQGSADARSFGDVAVRTAARPPFAVCQGTGLPITRLRTYGPGVATIGTAVTGTPRGEFIAQRFIAKHSAKNVGAQNDGTTLGFHTSSRPLS